MTSKEMTPMTMTENTNNELVEKNRRDVDKWLEDKKQNDPEFIKALSMLAK